MNKAVSNVGDGPLDIKTRVSARIGVMIQVASDVQNVIGGGLGVVCASWAACGNGLRNRDVVKSVGTCPQKRKTQISLG